MKNNGFRSILCWLLMLVMAINLTGCGDTATPHHLALVVVHQANAPVPDLNHAVEALTQVCENGGSACFIEADGAGFLVDEADVEAPKAGVSENTHQKNIQEKLNELLLKAGRCAPAEEQLNPLAALELAGRALANREGDRHIVVIGSGLSTQWPLDMSGEGVELANLDPQAVVELLRREEALPQHLEGVRITWYGVDQTYGPQEALGPKDVNVLKAMWTAIAEAAGAELTFSTELSIERAPAEGLPKVNTVEVQSRDTDLSFLKEPAVLDGTLAFASGSVELDPDNLVKVDEVLAPLVEILEDDPHNRIALFGATANDDTAQNCREYGRQRAEAVRDRMVALGADPGQIITVGIGWENHRFYTPDRTNGKLDEDIAPLNRNVYMMNADSEEAKSLIQAFDPID